MGMKFMPDLQFCKELPEIKPGEYRLKYDLTLRASPGLGTAGKLSLGELPESGK